GLLYKKNQAYPFYMASVVMVAALLVLYIFIEEPKEIENAENQKDAKQKAMTRDVAKNKSLILLLFAIFFWFTGFNAVETFFSLYGQHILGIDPSDSSLILTTFSLTFLIFAIPAGLIGSKIGRKKTILIGII